MGRPPGWVFLASINSDSSAMASYRRQQRALLETLPLPPRVAALPVQLDLFG